MTTKVPLDGALVGEHDSNLPGIRVPADGINRRGEAGRQKLT
jgi:hypothetical protein